MESIKVSKNAKSLVLDNGIELTYCEFGEENQDVMIGGAFYFYTFTPVLEEIAKRYHVYGVVMRFDGPTTEYNKDGSVNWSRQWGEDIYQFSKALGLNEYHYIGKCHSVNPGWYLMKEHPEVLRTFSSLYMAPHICEQNSNMWFETLKTEGGPALMSRAIRKQERIPIKLAELKTLGSSVANPSIEEYASSPEKIWDSKTDAEEFMKNVSIPVLLMYGTEDIVFLDHYDSSIKAFMTIKGCKCVFLNGERHLLEIDCPERIVSEVLFFIDESEKCY